MTKGKCVICGTKFTSKARNAKTCSPGCREEMNRRRAKNNYRKANNVDPSKPRSCYLCGADITGLHLRSVVCESKKCRRKHQYQAEKKSRNKNVQEIKEAPPPEIKVAIPAPRIVKPAKVEKKKPNQCTVPGCKSDRGSNRFWCGYHHKLKTRIAGRSDGDYGYETNIGSMRQRQAGGGVG